MLEPLSVKLGLVVKSLSQALDLAAPSFFRHAERVAYIAMRIADRLGLDKSTRRDLFLASLLHDIGTSGLDGKLELAQSHPPLEILKAHCIRGEALLLDTTCFRHLAPVIRHHHDYWDGRNGKTGDEIPLLSQIIHLADRLEVQIDRSSYILYQVLDLRDSIKGWSGTQFAPNLVRELCQICDEEAFWLDLETGFYRDRLNSCGQETTTTISLGSLEEIAELFAAIIDQKSQFTERHSRGVAARSVRIAALVGFSQADLKLMQVAGLLHDLGKLAIPNSILDLPGPLNNRQMQVMKQHTYWTYHLLSSLENDEIQQWAAFHHEKLDGSGYPFRLNADGLSTGSRIMAVSDVIQALAEPRPYRGPMPVEKIRDILVDLGRSGKLDMEIIELTVANLDSILEPEAAHLSA